jgi:hypothetical protein
LLPDRSHRHLLLFVRNHRYDLKGRGRRLCRHTHRTLPDAYSPLPHPGHERLGQSGAKHRAGAVAGGAYIAQLWLFWLAPILGAAIAGVVSRWQHDLPDALNLR